MQCRKNITVEGNKNKMNIANFINIYTNNTHLTKNNQNIFDYRNFLLLNPPQITRSNIEHCNHREKKTIILSYLSRTFPDKVN